MIKLYENTKGRGKLFNAHESQFNAHESQFNGCSLKFRLKSTGESTGWSSRLASCSLMERVSTRVRLHFKPLQFNAHESQFNAHESQFNAHESNSTVVR
ncbi:hypothetical protein JTE90_000022 [Oedothorax gibbosus]|uniref:Uncharacterized protein n=1 Tax=Oedothorax gibbosus TaxID=931172 RepID=A0AAV6TKF2_9ARAC|nr:hypothetical protein JTE90_000022 [Oedothorax gibbosus]